MLSTIIQVTELGMVAFLSNQSVCCFLAACNSPERAKTESDRRKEKLKEILGYEEAMQVCAYMCALLYVCTVTSVCRGRGRYCVSHVGGLGRISSL